MSTTEQLMTELVAEVRGLRTDLRAMAEATLSRAQAASYLGISLSQLEKYMAKGLLKPRKMGRRSMFFTHDLDRFRAEQVGQGECDTEAVRRRMAQALG